MHIRRPHVVAEGMLLILTSMEYRSIHVAPKPAKVDSSMGLLKLNPKTLETLRLLRP